MLNNYAKNIDGVIYQVDRKPFVYDIDYNLNYYERFKNFARFTSYLRLGYLIGNIKHIPHSILDVGYGVGTFLEVCESQIKLRYGNDVSGCDLPRGCKFVEDITKNYYEVITFFDSLEHMSDIEFVKDLKCDYVCISVPWCHYFSDDWFDKWKHRKPNEHLWHFDDKTLEAFMGRMGYSKISISNVEDVVRNNNQNYSNILTGIFRKNKHEIYF